MSNLFFSIETQRPPTSHKLKHGTLAGRLVNYGFLGYRIYALSLKVPLIRGFRGLKMWKILLFCVHNPDICSVCRSPVSLNVGGIRLVSLLDGGFLPILPPRFKHIACLFNMFNTIQEVQAHGSRRFIMRVIHKNIWFA